uniref:Secreted peptide n=1 Tax=Arundo donax TaxID=35708 RepID=A0A0A8ZCH4_ARUDO
MGLLFLFSAFFLSSFSCAFRWPWMLFSTAARATSAIYFRCYVIRFEIVWRVTLFWIYIDLFWIGSFPHCVVFLFERPFLVLVR